MKYFSSKDEITRKPSFSHFFLIRLLWTRRLRFWKPCRKFFDKSFEDFCPRDKRFSPKVRKLLTNYHFFNEVVFKKCSQKQVDCDFRTPAPIILPKFREFPAQITRTTKTSRFFNKVFAKIFPRHIELRLKFCKTAVIFLPKIENFSLKVLNYWESINFFNFFSQKGAKTTKLMIFPKRFSRIVSLGT